MTEPVALANGRLRALISPAGAELVSLVPAGGGEVIWSGDPAVWGWRAPNLFPIVGALSDDTLVHAGQRYPMKQHGFLRGRPCALVAAGEDSCRFRLTDDAETRRQYPFAFVLEIGYRLEGDRLDCVFELDNPGSVKLPASLGAHPGFRWPLADGIPREDHLVVFERDEAQPIRRLAGRVLDPALRPSPVAGRVLALTDALFAEDALIFDRPASRRLTYGAPGGPAIELAFADFPFLGLWSKPGGAPFLCLEPWQGHADPAGFAGRDFLEKPGIVVLAPGERRRWTYSIRPLPLMPFPPARATR